MLQHQVGAVTCRFWLGGLRKVALLCLEGVGVHCKRVQADAVYFKGTFKKHRGARDDS